MGGWPSCFAAKSATGFIIAVADVLWTPANKTTEGGEVCQWWGERQAQSPIFHAQPFKQLLTINVLTVTERSAQGFTSGMHCCVSMQWERCHGRERGRKVVLEVALLQLSVKQLGLVKGRGVASQVWAAPLIQCLFPPLHMEMLTLVKHRGLDSGECLRECRDAWPARPSVTYWWYQDYPCKCSYCFSSLLYLLCAASWYKEDFSFLRDMWFPWWPTILAVGRCHP